MGLLDFLSTPQGQALASGIATYASTARRGTPVNNVGRGLLGYTTSLVDQGQEADAKKLRDMQMQQMQMQMDEIKRKQQESVDQRSAIKNIVGTEPQPYQADTFDSADTPPTGIMEGTGLMGGKIKQADIPKMMLGIKGMEEEAFKAMIPKQPKYGVVERYNAQGFPEKVIIDENNPFNAVPFGGAKAEKPEVRPIATPAGNFQDTAFDPMTGQEKYRLGSPYKKGPNAAESKLSVGNISLNTEKKYGEKFGEKVADLDVSMRDAALNAPSLADRSKRILDTLKSGNVITGFGADFRLDFAKAIGLAGASNTETIANTEALSADLARNTLDQIKASGLGSGNGFSNADRDFLNKAAGGLIGFDAKSIEKLANLSYKAAQASANKWSKRVQEIPETALSGTGITREAVKIPSIGMPLPAKPSAMTLKKGQAYDTPKGVLIWDGNNFVGE